MFFKTAAFNVMSYSHENTFLINFIKKRLQHRCFPVNDLYHFLSKLLRRPFGYFPCFNPSQQATQRSSRLQMFFNKGVCKFLQISQETPVLESLFNIVAGLKAYNFIKRRPQHRCFLVNKRPPFLKNTSGGFFWTQYKSGNRQKQSKV